MMSEIVSSLPSRLREIVEDFSWAEGREKLELLLQYAEDLPPLPTWLADNLNAMQPIPECMTPVSVYAETKAGQMIFYFDVPESSPTVRGYASILEQGLRGATPEQVLKLPNDFYKEMGLDQVLTYQRLNGIAAILAHMRVLALKEAAREQGPAG
jgi:cysteine desulfuration protein SufE